MIIRQTGARRNDSGIDCTDSNHRLESPARSGNLNGRLRGRNDALEAGATIRLAAVILMRIRVTGMMGRWLGLLMAALQHLFGCAREIRCEKQ